MVLECPCGERRKPSVPIDTIVEVRYGDFGQTAPPAFNPFGISYNSGSNGFEVDLPILVNPDRIPGYGAIFFDTADNFCQSPPPTTIPGAPPTLEAAVVFALRRKWRELCECIPCQEPQNDLCLLYNGRGQCICQQYEAIFSVSFFYVGGAIEQYFTTRYPIGRVGQIRKTVTREAGEYRDIVFDIRHQIDCPGAPPESYVDLVGGQNVLNITCELIDIFPYQQLFIDNCCEGENPETIDPPIPPPGITIVPPEDEPPTNPNSPPPPDVIIFLPCGECAPGAQGEKGDKGDKGDTGARGPTGATGARGLQGIQGVPGAAGATGATGAAGANGRDGTNGRDGVDGAPGEAATFSIASVERVPFGSGNRAIPSGTAQNRVYSLELEEEVEIRNQSIETKVCNAESGIQTVLETVPVIATKGGTIGVLVQLFATLIGGVLEEYCKGVEETLPERILGSGTSSLTENVFNFPLGEKKKGRVRVELELGEEAGVRAYKLAGRRSEYGLGNVSFLAGANSDTAPVIGGRTDLFLIDSLHLLPEVDMNLIFRLSLKPGINYKVFFTEVKVLVEEETEA